MRHTGQPTVILAKTIKGYALGTHFAGRNATHQMKKLSLDDLKAFRDSLKIPVSDEQLEAEATRLEAIGATRVRKMDEWSGKWIVMLDPEGNEFCLQ